MHANIMSAMCLTKCLTGSYLYQKEARRMSGTTSLKKMEATTSPEGDMAGRVWFGFQVRDRDADAVALLLAI